MHAIEVQTQNLQVQTLGLARLEQQEIRASVSEVDLLSGCEAFIRYVVAYIVEQNARILPGETMSYGLWLIKFQAAEDGLLEAWEINIRSSEDAITYLPGVTSAVSCWQEQQAICAASDAQFTPSHMEQYAVISLGVLEDDPVESVRYPSPEHMSGWWITTDRYDGDTTSLIVQHLRHVIAARPELARYLALPYGFRFATGKGQEQIWFDSDVANEETG